MGKGFKRRASRAAAPVAVPAPVAAPVQRDNVVPIRDLPKVREEKFAGFPFRKTPELRRTFDASEVNEILNAPGVFEHLAIPQLERLDCAAILANGANIALVCDGGCFLFFCHSPGIYDACIAFLPGSRGAYAVEASRKALELLFLETDCMTIMLRVPEDNKRSRRLAGLLGAKLEFRRHAVWPVKGGLVGMDYLAFRYENWALSGRGLVDAGRAFAARLFDERDRLGVLNHTADIDLENPQFIGAFAKMAFAGQLDKAVILYNRFAAFALLPPIALISRAPAMVEIGGTLIQIKDGSFKAILIRGNQ